MLATQPKGRSRHVRAVVVPIIAVAGATAAIAAGAVPAAATSAHHVKVHHKSHAKTRHVVISGLVAGHHKRTITVFAKTAKLGAKTKHNQRFHVTFAHSVHGRVHIPVGDHIKLTARGRVNGHSLVIVHNSSETVAPSPASLVFGTVEFIDGNLVTISQHERDNGDGARGNDNEDGDSQGQDATDDGDSQGGGDQADVRTAAVMHSHDGGGDNQGEGGGHSVTIDDTNAAITVDGSEGALAVGDTVAVLGEVTSDTFVASTIYAFTTTPSFERGEVQSVTGNIVTLDNDGNTDTVDLTEVPLVINGDAGSLPSQLTAGDKLVVIGQFDSTDNTFTPDLAFAFNGHDNGPCGHNEGGDGNGDSQGSGSGEGSDG